ncbi:hypothetical protein AVEN_61558-1 [Araneus ventricosus]|uniref:Uncharacterized protein n=1 Tax=Araneus ventricosus TaxID=182803 RepID=A0A4Y2MJ88_ARAVE|nr:hypothetical protein AVEN_61558-1 [Araneus ventricosus]
MPYKLQLLNELKPDDKPRRRIFAEEMFSKKYRRMKIFYNVFSDEATFHLSGIVNRHSTRIWRLENPLAVLEQARDKQVNVWCGLLHDQIKGNFFFSKVTVRSDNDLDPDSNFSLQ